ncbi:MAG TPA: PDZ domain-containing protein, partial [Longimicrobiales bacterium]|nr:PDZ domain-containing protein [Longimicrobiales bacterium]
MTRSRFPFRLALGAVALAALGLGAPGAAQTARVEARQECRCVDRDGNEIENCTCIRAPRIEIVRGPLAGGLFQRRSQIGVWISGDQDEEANRQGGVLLTEVQADGPAGEAGLRAGDVVLRVAGRSLLDPLPDAEDEEALDLDQSIPVQRFVRLVGALEPGEPVEFQLVRDGQRRTVTVTPEAAEGAFGIRMGEAPWIHLDEDAMRLDLRGLEEGAARLREEMEVFRELEGEPGARVWRFQAPEGERVFEFRRDSVPGRTAFSFFGGDPCFTLERGEGRAFTILAGAGNCVDGVEFVELNPGLAEYFEASEGGVLVTEVSEESALGLRAGDVLLAIDGRDVRDPAHVRRVL